MSDDAIFYQICLSLIPGVGNVTSKVLINHFGNACDVFRASLSELQMVPDIGPYLSSAVKGFNNFKQAEAELKFIKENGISLLAYQDDSYPHRLRHCHDSPILLYYKGKADLNHPKIIAIVGTRKATDYGRQVTEEFVHGLKDFNVMILSGLAIGIDATAHRSALKVNLPTVGVLGHGLDRVYPGVHKQLAHQMLEQGGILSEFPTGTMPDAMNFPARNRVVAGMADAVLVVEAAEKGGALITAELANGYNRDVFAIPGRINDPFSIGCNQLIAQNKAHLVRELNELAEMLNWTISGKAEVKAFQKELFSQYSEEQQKLLCQFQGQEKLSLDILAIRSGYPVSKTASLLLNLEFSGIIRSFPGKLYGLN